MSRDNRPDKPATLAPTVPKYFTHEGAEIRGDKIYLTARKIGSIGVFRRTGQHNAQEVTADKDARAVLLRAYTSTRKP